MIPMITNRNVLMADVDTAEETAKMFNDVYRILRAHNLALLKLSGKGEGKKGGEKTPPAKVSAMKKVAMAVVVFCLALSSVVSGSVPWRTEYGLNPQLYLDAFMRNPQWTNIETDTITLANGATFANSTNNAFTWAENSEDLIWTVGTNLVTVSSSTGVLKMDYDTIIVGVDEVLFNPVTDANSTEGTVYYDSDNDNLYVSTTAGWVDLTATSTSTFDDIYNNSAAALGITVDVGPTVWTATNAANVVIFSLIQSDTGTSQVITITNAGTGNTIDIEGQAAGKDIEGTGDTWNVTGAGAATFVSAAIPSLTSTTVTLSNGGTIANTTDTEIVFGENSEDISLDFTTDGLTVKSSTGVAAIDWGDVDDFTGFGSLTFDATVATINLPADGAGDNLTISVSGTQDAHLTISSAGTTEDALTLSTSNGGINISNSGASGGEDIDISSSASSVNISAAEAVDDAITIVASTALGGIDITSQADIDITTTGAAGEDIGIVNTGGSILVQATESATDAVIVQSTLGGVQILASGASAGEDILLTATGSSIRLSATESATDAVVVQSTIGGVQILAAAAADTEDILLTATGSSIFLTSTQAVPDAIKLNASDAAGGITVAYGTGNMAITGTGVSADFSIDADLISIDGTGASNISFANAAGEDVTIATTGAADHSLILTASGTAADALQLSATAATGGITVGFGTGNMAVTGTGVSADFALDCDLFSIDGTGTSNVTVTSTAGSEDFTIALAGAFDSSLILSSTGTAADALQITASAGGILCSPSGAMADQFKVLAAGTIAGNAINLATTNGGIVLTAGNADNGDLTLTVDDDWTATVTGNTAINNTGTMAITSSDWRISTDGVVAKINAITFDTGGAGIDANAAPIAGFKYAVQHALANDTLAADESGAVVYVAKAGAGAASDITITVPAATAGLTYTIVDANETAAADVTIRAGGGDKINDGAAAGAYVHDTDADNYASVTLFAIDDTDWILVATPTGTWVNE